MSANLFAIESFAFRGIFDTITPAVSANLFAMKRVRQRFDQIHANPFHEDLDDLVYYAIKGECSRAYLRYFIRQENINITPEDITETHKVLTDFTKEFYTRGPGYTTTVVELYEIPEFKLPVLSLYRKFREEFNSPGFVFNLALQGCERLLDDLLIYGRVNGEEVLKHYQGYNFNARVVQVILNRRPDLINDTIVKDLLYKMTEDDLKLYEFIKPRVSADTTIKCLLKHLERHKMYLEPTMMIDWMDPDSVDAAASMEPLEYYAEVSEDNPEYKTRFEMLKGLIHSEGVDLGYILQFVVENDLAGMFSYFRETFPDFPYDRDKLNSLATEKECEKVIKLI